MNNTDQAFIKAYSKQSQTRQPAADSAASDAVAHYVAPETGAHYRVEPRHETPAPHSPEPGSAVPEQAENPFGSVAAYGHVSYSDQLPSNTAEGAGSAPAANRPAAPAPPTAEPEHPSQLWSHSDPIVVEMPWYASAPTTTPDEPTEAERRNQQAAKIAFDEPPVTAPQPEPAATPAPPTPVQPQPPATQPPQAAAPAAPPAPQPTAPTGEPQPAAAPEPAPAAPEKPSFRAVWEVDQFAWDETVDQITSQLRGELRYVGRQLARTANEGLHVMALAGLAPQAGTTTVAIQLAQAAAAERLNVAIVDANYDSPGLSDALGVDAENGWDDALSNGLPLEEAAIQSLNDEITLLPLSPLAGRGRRAARQQLGRLLHELTDVFDLILVDTGSAEAFIAGLENDYPPAQINAAVVVCTSEQLHRDAIGDSIDRIRAAGVDQIGLIENRCSA